MKVEVAYSPAPRVVDLCSVEIVPGTTVAQAVEVSGLPLRHSELRDGPELVFGIWGRVCRADRRVAEGDRVEIYRPLIIDPKEARRSRGREQQQAKAARRR